MRILLLSLSLIAIPFLSAFATDFHVYYLGGQSNMDGYGYVEQLPEELKSESKEVWIFHGNTSKDRTPVDGRGLWAKLKPGHGVGFRSDGKTNTYSKRFGVELSFARQLQQQYPDRRIAIIKYSRGGTSIDIRAAGGFGCWEPDFNEGTGEGKGINQYDHFLRTIRNAFAVQDIDGDGKQDRLIPAGIVWMQGESDAAQTPEVAKMYEHHLKRLMDLIRASLRSDDLPVVIGRISDSKRDNDGKVWDQGEIVREAQASFVKKDPTAFLVTSTDKYGYSDKWHYDTKGYLDLGKEFAIGFQSLEKTENNQK